MTDRPDAVKLVVPASAEYAMIARLVASGLASRHGMSYDEVEDLRVVVAEVCRLLVGDSGGDGEVTFVFDLTADALELEGRTSGVRPAAEPDDDDLSISLLSALSDEYEASLDGEPATVRIVKRYSR